MTGTTAADVGSYPGCCTPSSHIGSVHLSGCASLSSKYRIALSRCPFPCFAAVSSALGPLPFGDVFCASRLGNDRSFVDVLNVCVNHPDSRVGRSPIRDVDEVEEYSVGGRA